MGCALYSLNNVDVNDYSEPSWQPVTPNQKSNTYQTIVNTSEESSQKTTKSLSDIQEEIQKLNNMKKKGLLNEAEYQALKDKIINNY